MNIFVASWFFPPATSSEGIVTYKLLKNSKHQYDVFSSVSMQWGYKSKTELRAENITSYTIETDDIDQWASACVEEFERLYPTRKYACIMTRSMPPESILVGQAIKEKHPEIKWIASFNDPIANNPYEIKAYIDDCLTLRDGEKESLKAALRGTDEELLLPWEDRPEAGIRLMCKLKRWENIALKQADMILCPTGDQMRYMLGSQSWTPKLRVLPHSFDPSFYTDESAKKTDKVVFSFIGYSDTFLRSLEPLVKAVRLLRENGSPYLDRLQMRFIGNNPRMIQDMVLDYYLEDVIQLQDGVDYYRSLALMQESDWLIHVDAFFPMLSATGGSIFFAGKLADYMGAGKPIFALTGKGSPADAMIRKMGGVSVIPWETAQIADQLEDILSGKTVVQPSAEYVANYRADRVAACFDGYVEQLCGAVPWQPRGSFPPAEASHPEKLMTVCVPSYNVERYLERCVKTLIDHEYAADMEVLIVDDGSKDRTAEIGKAFERQYPGIVRLIQKENGGHGSTINRAVQEAKGLYFKVVDGDDWVDSKQLGKLVGKIKSGEIDTDIVSARYHQVNMETGQLTPWAQDIEVEYLKPYNFDEIDLENTYFTLHSSWFKLSILKEMATPLQEHTFYVDVELILFPVPYLKTVTFVDSFIYKYCVGNAEQSVHIPTMVKRYDQHERVMMRVIRYKNEHDMPDAQRTYYDAILKRHLYTQYALFMVYNPQKKDAYAIGKRFDQFLRQEDPALAKWAGRHIPLLRSARLCGFNYSALKFTPGFLVSSVKTGAKNWLKSSRLLRVLVRNRFTARIGQTHFFKEGKGKALKERVKGVISG